MEADTWTTTILATDTETVHTTGQDGGETPTTALDGTAAAITTQALTTALTQDLGTEEATPLHHIEITTTLQCAELPLTCLLQEEAITTLLPADPTQGTRPGHLQEERRLSTDIEP